MKEKEKEKKDKEKKEMHEEMAMTSEQKWSGMIGWDAHRTLIYIIHRRLSAWLCAIGQSLYADADERRMGGRVSCDKKYAWF